MSTQEVFVPDIGDFEDVDVIEVHVEVGQEIQLNDPMITLENDKASMDLPATVAGVVKEVKVNVGEKVSEGSLIMVVEASGEASDTSAAGAKSDDGDQKASSEQASSPKKAPAADSGADKAPASPKAASQAAPKASSSGKVPDFSRIHASPSIRRFAREQDVDLNLVRGTGRKGRVTREDILDFLAKGDVEPAGRTRAPAGAPPAAGGAGIPAVPPVDFSKFGPVEVQAIGRIKRLTAAAMTRSWLNVPHVTHNDEADVTELEAFRKAIKEEAKALGTRVSILSFAMKAVAATLKAFPTFNASLDPTGENLILKQYYHIGIAVDTPNGLVVPVIKDVDQKSVYSLSDELIEISKKARDNKLKLSDIQGATFTISSLGGIGGTTFTPIVNAPEVAILGMTRSKMQPMWNGKEFVPRLMQPLSLSYDHRVIDGAEAARFCRHLATLLEDIRRLLL